VFVPEFSAYLNLPGLTSSCLASWLFLFY